MGAYVVVQVPAREDDLRVMADLLGLIGEVIGVHTDAMPPAEPGAKGEEVPLGSRRFENLGGIDTEALEDHGALVDKGDVENALCVLDDLGGLRDAD